jgi:hypothetical protein
MLFGRREGKGGHFFRIIMQKWIFSYAWTAGNWRAHSLFDALLMMNARKRRWQEDLACFSFFVKFSLSPKMHHDGDAKRIGRASMDSFIISSLYYHN